MVLHPLTFNLKVSSSLKWTSCRQHIDGSSFFIHCVFRHNDTLCLLIGAFSPFTFRVIVGRYGFNDTATTDIYTRGYTLSLHDALPILNRSSARHIIVKLAKYKDKEKILKAARDKRALTFKGDL